MSVANGTVESAPCKCLEINALFVVVDGVRRQWPVNCSYHNRNPPILPCSADGWPKIV